MGAVLACVALASAQDQPQQKKLETRPQKQMEQEPPEEDESLKPEEYTLNPLEAQRNINIGNYYFKTKRNYNAAARRFLRATKWDPGSPEAFIRLAEAEEKLNDRAAAREAYEKYLELSPSAKNASSIRKRIEHWPKPAAK
jgi:predicted Zn-dependent protease